MASQQPSPPQLQSPSPPLPHSTTPSKPLDKNTKTQGKPLQEIQSTSYHPISPSTTNTILTITFLALITILSIIHLIHQSTANVFEISNIFLLSPILSIISIAALLWRKYKSWRVRRMILDEEEEAVGWMDEDETLEEGGELYAVGWEDGSRDTTPTMPPPPPRPSSPQPLLHRALEYHFGDAISLMDGSARIPAEDHGYKMWQIRASYIMHFVVGMLLGFYFYPVALEHGPAVWLGVAFLVYCYSQVSWWLWGKDMHGDYLRLREREREERMMRLRDRDDEARIEGKDGKAGVEGGSGKNEETFLEDVGQKKEKRGD
ncbi:beta-ketoacyl synthase [Stemphylium lycopersici]|nr:beta-ketoacyl synthase [Stemphylium lycopersici]